MDRVSFRTHVLAEQIAVYAVAIASIVLIGSGIAPTVGAFGMAVFVTLAMWLSSRAKCPRCHWPTYKRKRHIFGVEISTFSRFIPRRCRNCNYDFTAKPGSKQDAASIGSVHTNYRVRWPWEWGGPINRSGSPRSPCERRGCAAARPQVWTNPQLSVGGCFCGIGTRVHSCLRARVKRAGRVETLSLRPVSGFELFRAHAAQMTIDLTFNRAS